MQHVYRTQQNALESSLWHASHHAKQIVKIKYMCLCHPNLHLVMRNTTALSFGLQVSLLHIAKIPKERKFPCLDEYIHQNNCLVLVCIYSSWQVRGISFLPKRGMI